MFTGGNEHETSEGFLHVRFLIWASPTITGRCLLCATGFVLWMFFICCAFARRRMLWCLALVDLLLDLFL